MKQIIFLVCAIGLLAFAFCLTASAENEALYFPNGQLYIPHANLLDGSGNTVVSYAAYLQKYSRGWKFKLVGVSEISTNATSTNATNTVSVAGNWDFGFTYANDYNFNGTNFYQTTNMNFPSVVTIPMTLVQTNEDVTGTGTTNSVQYTLSGQIAGDLFSFSLLAGTTNKSMTLTSAHVAVTTNSMAGDYFASTNITTAINTGTLNATKK